MSSSAGKRKNGPAPAVAESFACTSRPVSFAGTHGVLRNKKKWPAESLACEEKNMIMGENLQRLLIL